MLEDSDGTKTNEERDNISSQNSTTFSLDVSQKRLSEAITSVKIGNKFALFPEPMNYIYADNLLISHESGSDFQLVLGKYHPAGAKAIAQIMLVFNFAALVKFRNKLSEILNQITTETSSKVTKRSIKVTKVKKVVLQMSYPNDLIYFSPTEFMFHNSGNIFSMFFGRSFGMVDYSDGKSYISSLFNYECIMDINQVISMHNAIDININIFETNYNVKLDQVAYEAKG